MLEIIKKDLRLMFRERTFLSVVFLLLFVASISSIITFGLIMLYNPGYFSPHSVARVAVVGDCSLGECFDENTALRMFKDGKVDAVLVVRDLEGLKFVDIIVPDDKIKAAQVLSYVKKILVDYEGRLRLQYGVPNFEIRVFSDGREVSVPSGSSAVFKFVYLILIPLLAITTAVVAAGMTIDSVCEEIQSKSIEVLLSTPLPPFSISAGKIASPMIFSSSLILLWLLLLSLNGIDITNPAAAFILSLALTALFVAFAYIISVKLRDRERAQLLFSIIAAGILPVMLTKSISPAVMVGRVAAGAEISLPTALFFTAVSFLLLAVSPLIAKISEF